MQIIISIVSILAGGSLIIFCKFFARLVIKQQNKFWGFHFGNHGIKVAEIVSIIVGIGFIIIGILSLFR